MRFPSALRGPSAARHAGLVALLVLAACREDAGPLAPSAAIPGTPGFVVAGASMIELGSFPGGGLIHPTAINDAGHVVGVAYPGGSPHAFLWTPQEGIQDLDSLLNAANPLGMNSMALDVNNSGQILYFRWDASHGHRNFVWTPGPSGAGTSVELPFADGRAINNAGQVLRSAAVWTPAGSGTGGTMRNLDGLGYASLWVNDINDAGQVVGYVSTAPELHAVVWQPDGSTTILPGLGGTLSMAVGINGSGWVSGQSTTPSNQDYRAVIWSPAGVVQDLGIDVDGAQAVDINDDRVVLVGAADLVSLWTEADGERDLRPVGTSMALAGEINNAGQVIGLVAGPAWEGGFRGVLWGNALNVAPVARLGGPYTAMVGAAIPFDASGSSDANHDALAFAWDFDGNGTTDASGASAQHAYSAAGEYTARLVVSDPGGRADTATAAVSVGATVAGIAINGPYVGLEGSLIPLSSAGSETVDGGAPKWYRWDFGDGTQASSVYQTTPFAWSKRYSDDGTYVLTLTVASQTGTVRVARTTVTVTNAAPGATLSGPSSAGEGSTPAFVFSSATDPGAADRAAGFDYALDCGSGYFGAWQASPTLVCPAIPDEDLNPRQVRARVRDKDGGVSEYLRSLTVTGRPPVVQILSASLSGGTATISFRFTDPGAYDSLWRYRVVWGDGSPSPQIAAQAQGMIITVTHTYTGPITSPVYVVVSDKDSRAGRSPDITF
jgi:probable HAF family extracellular repeat protein